LIESTHQFKYLKNELIKNIKSGAFVHRQLSKAFKSLKEGAYLNSLLECHSIFRETDLRETAHYISSIAHLNNNNYKKAKCHIDIAISLNPDCPDYYYILACIEYMINKKISILQIIDNKLQIKQKRNKQKHHFEKVFKNHEIQPIILNVLPKSGSQFLFYNLIFGLEIPSTKICTEIYHNVYPEYIERFVKEKKAVAAKEHFPATYRNLLYLKQYGIEKMIVNFRDPRQAIL